MQSLNKIEKSYNDKSIETKQFRLLLEVLYAKIMILSEDLPVLDELQKIQLLGTAISLIDSSLVIQKPVLRIGLEIKSHKTIFLHPHSMLIHANDHHPLLSMITINSFSCIPEVRDLIPKIELTLSFKNTKQPANAQKYFIREGSIVKIMDELRELAFKIDLVEYKSLKCITELAEKKAGIFSLKDWDGDWDNQQIIGGHYDYYNEINDPIIIGKFQNEVLPLAKQLKKGEVLTVLDIGAGKGRLAFKLLLEAEKRTISLHYILLEPSSAQLKIARKLLEYFSKDKRLKTTCMESTLENLSLPNKVHCVISSGGPLNMFVVSRSSALKNLERIKQHLLPGGIFIGTGLTMLLVNSKHFKNAGMVPLSYSIPMTTQKLYPKLRREKLHHFFQCYVAKNPEFEISADDGFDRKSRLNRQ